MTYNEAEILLNTLERNPYPYNGEPYVALIVPEIIDERMKFIADIQKFDVDVKDYSTNGQYTINGYSKKAFNL
jgi:hypothetical protein